MASKAAETPPKLELEAVTLPPLPAGVPAFTAEALEPGAVPSRKKSDQLSAQRQEYFEALVRTAPRDKPTAYRGIPADKLRGFAVSLGKAVSRLGLRDTFEVGTASKDGADFAYLKPKRTKASG